VQNRGEAVPLDQGDLVYPDPERVALVIYPAERGLPAWEVFHIKKAFAKSQIGPGLKLGNKRWQPLRENSHMAEPLPLVLCSAHFIIHSKSTITMTCPAPTPSTSISDDLAAQRIGLFATGKYSILNNWVRQQRPGINEAQSVSYTPAQFIALADALSQVDGIAGVKVYFASYLQSSPATDPYLPQGMEDLMTLVFAACDADNRDTGDYFTIDPTGTLPAPAVKRFADTAVPLSWNNYYQQDKLPLLQAAGQKTNPSFQETKLIMYPLSNFQEWADVLNCSGQPGSPVITAVLWSFATYLATETYAGQLGEVITLVPDSTAVSSNAAAIPQGGGGGGSNDTGSPCPPDDVCGPTT